MKDLARSIRSSESQTGSVDPDGALRFQRAVKHFLLKDSD